VLQHLDREGPGSIAQSCVDRRLTLDVRRLDLGAQVPKALDGDDILIVMGGPMGVGDVGDPRYPFLAPEIELLRTVLANGLPVLGICLGSQLLANAAGARVYPNQGTDASGARHPLREVGFGHVRLLGTNREAALNGLPSSLPVLHWHGDTFDLPQGAVHLADNDVCANQAFRIGRRAFGLQFHVETDADQVRRWAEEDAAFVLAALGSGGPNRIVAESDAAFARMRGTADQLMRNILDEMLAHDTTTHSLP
jgi:GMP synthase (glutamine-hydrolysing)